MPSSVGAPGVPPGSAGLTQVVHWADEVRGQSKSVNAMMASVNFTLRLFHQVRPSATALRA